jgi:uncharacterized RDD family membrane protein YckC
VNTTPERPQTTSNSVRPASPGRRLVAFLLDLIPIAGYVLALIGLGIGVTAVVGPLEEISPLFASPVFRDVLAFLVLVLPVMLYFTIQESSSRRATWGKRKAGIRVVNAGGETLSRKRALVRAALKLLPWQIAHTSIFHIEGLPFPPADPSGIVMAGFVLAYLLAGIYVVSMLVSRQHRTPYDWAAGSYVVVAGW